MGIQEVWEELNATMKLREESLGEASKLQGFLRDLDDFQSWLSRTQTAVASEDIPTSLVESESLLAQHESIKNEVDNYKEDYEKMRDVGEEVTRGQLTLCLPGLDTQQTFPVWFLPGRTKNSYTLHVNTVCQSLL